MTKSDDDFDQYKYSAYVCGFDAHRKYLSSDGSGFGKICNNVIISGTDMCSYVYIDNNKKDILILGKSQADCFDDTMLTAEKKYFINLTEQQKRLYYGLQYNWVSIYIFVNVV